MASTAWRASSIPTADGTAIYYKDWGAGQPIVFSRAWPLSADASDEQLFLVASNGRRGIAHDQVGHGRSGPPWEGHDMDTYADDLSALLEDLDVRDVILVGTPPAMARSCATSAATAPTAWPGSCS